MISSVVRKPQSGSSSGATVPLTQMGIFCSGMYSLKVRKPVTETHFYFLRERKVEQFTVHSKHSVNVSYYYQTLSCKSPLHLR